MKIILFGSSGTLGSAVQAALTESGHEVIGVSRSEGQRADMRERSSLRELYKRVGTFDAVASAAGEVAFGPLAELGAEQWEKSLASKLMGQIQLVQEAIPFISERGSFTLISGVLSHDPIPHGVAATMVNRGIEGFVAAAAIALPKLLRINVVSPTLLEESAADYAGVFPGFVPVPARLAAQAYLKSILGAQTGQTYRV